MKNCNCDTCQYCRGYTRTTTSSFYCKHPNQKHIEAYAKAHNIAKLPYYIGISEKYGNVPKNKTTPKWCPKEAEVKNNEC